MNESNGDRIARGVAGVVLLALGFTVLNGAFAAIAVVVGLILVVTGAVGFCPIYAALKTGTRKVTGGSPSR